MQIDRLLLRRELLFSQVAQIEENIEDILGQPYPFPEPPELPSSQKRRRAGKRKSGSGGRPNNFGRAGSEPSVNLRGLGEGEAGYAVIWLSEEQKESCEIVSDGPLIEKSLSRPSASLQIIRVETVDKEGERVEVLWESAKNFDEPENPEKRPAN